jgi:hypothetical protein
MPQHIINLNYMVSVLECYELPLPPTTMDAVSAIIVAG